MVRSAHCGLDEAVSAIEEYAHCLQIASFVPFSGKEEELIQKYIVSDSNETLFNEVKDEEPSEQTIVW
jgi:hypothetical protein